MSFSSLRVEMCSKRLWANSLAVDSQVFIIGGNDGSTTLSSCEVFDSRGKTFRMLPTSMCRRRDGACAAVQGGRIFIFGGSDGSTKLSSCEVYDLRSSSSRSSTFTMLPTAMCRKRDGACAATQGDRIFIFGGNDGSTTLSSCEVFDPRSNTFTMLTSTMCNKRYCACAVVHKDRILIFGGRDDSTILSSCEVFDPRSNSFAMLTSTMCSKRIGACAVVHGERVLIFGGYDGSTTLSSCEVFDPRSNTFTMLTSTMCNKRQGACAVLQIDRVFIFGGHDFSSKFSSCEMYALPQVAREPSEDFVKEIFLVVDNLRAELSSKNDEVGRLQNVERDLAQLRAQQLRFDHEKREAQLVMETCRKEKQESENLLAAARQQVRQLQVQHSAVQPPSLFDPQAPYAWNQARFPSSGVVGSGGARPSFLVHSPDCPSDVRELVVELMANRGGYRGGFAARPVAGFQVYRIEIVDRSATTRQALQARLQMLDNLRSTKAQEVQKAELAVNEDAEMLRVMGELKGMFLTRCRRTNAMLTFHGTRVDFLEDILSAGLQKYCREDSGYFGYGCYTTPSLEYAAQYASGELSREGLRPTSAEGCWPVVLFAVAVGLAYPVTRANSYATPEDRFSFSRFYGSGGHPRPLFNGAVDTHVAGVSRTYLFQAAPVDEVEYLELVSAETQSLHPLAVLWVRK